MRIQVLILNILIISVLCALFLISITNRTTPVSDQRLEQELRLQIADLRAHLELAEQVIIDTKEDLRTLKGGQNLSEDLNLPSIRYSLPHVTKSPKSLNLAFKWSKGTVFENHSNKSNVNFFWIFWVENQD